MASNSATVGFLRVLLSANTAEFDQGIQKSAGGLKSFLGRIDEVLGGFKDLGGEGGVLAGAMGKVSGAVGNVASGISALGPAGAAAAVGVVAVSAGVVALVAASVEAGVELYKVTKFAADMGDELLNLSNKTGISVEALSELKFVGQQADVPLDNITSAIFKLGQTLSEGGDKAKKGLGAIGVSFEEIRKLSPDKAFELVISRLHDIPDAGQRAAAGVALFGKGFKEVSQLTQEDMKGLIGQAHDLDLVMSTEFAVAGDRFNNALHSMGAQMEAVEAKIGAQFLPVAIALVETFGTQLTAALSVAGKGAGDLSGIIADAAVVIGQALAAVVSVGAQAAKFLVEFFAGSFIVNFGLLEFFGKAVTALGQFLTVASYIQPGLQPAIDAAFKAGKAIQDFAVAGEKSTAKVAGNLIAYADAVDAAATVTGIALPGAVEKVKAEIAKTAAEMRKAQDGAAGFGHGIADGTKQATTAAEKAAAKMQELSDQIDLARTRGISASDEILLFGKDALKASDDAQKAGVAIASNVADVAQSEKDLVAANYFAKITDQMRLANEKIIEEEDKRQQRGLDDLLKLTTANLEYENGLTDLYRTGVDAQIAEIERRTAAELAALPVETEENREQIEIRKQQIREEGQWRIDAANGMYHTLGELEQASGAQTVADLRQTAEKAQMLYEQMRDSGAFSAQDVQKAWEESLKAQADAMGGFKGDLLTMYSGLASQLSETLGHMVTHVKGWRSDLKKIWDDISGDFASVLASMLKRWIEGFLMKLLASITGSRGAFASEFSGLLAPPGEGAGAGGGLGGGSPLSGILSKLIPGLGGAAAFGAGTTGGLVFGAGAPAGSAVIGVPTTFAPGFGGAGTTTAGMSAGLSGLLGGVGAGAAGFGTGALFQHLFGGPGLASGAAGGGAGALEGAIIGSIVPGIGTAIGALIGGLSGLLGGVINFGPSKKQVASRGIVSDFQQQTSAGLTDAQRTEAMNAGWADPEAAGTLIAVRDAYLSVGKSSRDAERDVKALWESEKQGPDATNAAMAPLLAALDEYRKKTEGTVKATSEAVDAQKAKYAELKASISSQMDDLNKQLADIEKSEAPEAIMGVEEKRARDRIEKAKAELDAQLKAVEQQNAEAMKRLGEQGAEAGGVIGDAVAQIPEKMPGVVTTMNDGWVTIGDKAVGPDGFGKVSDYLRQTIPGDGAFAFQQLSDNFRQGLMIPVTFVPTDDTGGAGVPVPPPPPGFAVGTPNLDFMDFGKESLVRLHGWEAVVPRDQAGAFAAKHGADTGMGMASGSGGSVGGSFRSVTVLQVDKRELGRAVADVLPGELRRLGVRVRA